MIKKSIKTHTRLLTCLVALAVVFVTFLAGMSTTNASTDVFGDIELKVGDTLGFVYYTSQPYTENTKMRFTVNGRTSESIAYPNDGKCVFIFNDIYPHELAKEVTATIVVNGKDTVSSTGLSIKTYLLKMLMDPDSTAEELQFASDTLQYGEQTRLYRNANVDVADRDNVSITDDINTSIYTRYNPQDIESVYPGTAQGLGVSASNIRLSSIGISYYNVNKYVVTLQIPTGSNINFQNIKVQIGNETFGASSFIEKGNGQYEVHSSAINAYDILDGNTPINTDIKLYVNNKIVQQASYNVLDYIYQLQDTTQNNSLALRYARSLYRYGQSAEAAYKGNRIVSIALKQNPGDANGQMVPSDTNAQTPTGGKITAYYSDGTSGVISEGITWNNKDIYGNEIKITNDTHLQSFTVLGSYTDTVSGKTYTVTGVIELHNDMVNAVRYNDPSEYTTSSSTWSTSYTPTGSQLRCTWANGYVDNRNSTHSAIDMTNYKFDEYGFIPTTASYTDPKSGITKSATTYLVYRNPITSINLNDTTANYNDGTLDANTIPHTTTYTLTFQNGQTWSTTKATTETTWTNSIQSGDSATNVTYSFAWTVMGSTSSEVRISFNQTATGNLTTPAYGTWVKKVNGNNSNVSFNSRTVTGNCNAVVSNPEHGLVIENVPAVYGGTVKGTGNLTGKPSSTTAGQLSGGKVYMRYWNNATEYVSSSTASSDKVAYSSAGIANTDYSDTVTVTASYTGKDGKNKTATADIIIYNYLVKIEQTKVPEVRAASTTNVNFPLTSTAGTMTATYANGTTEVVGDGLYTTTNIYINGGQRNSECYVQSISSASVTTADRTQAGVSATTGDRYDTVVKYDDKRTSDTYTGSIQTITGYKVKVRNTYESISTERVGPVYMTGANATPKPTNAVTVVLSNGQSITHNSPTYGQPESVTTAVEYQDKTVSVACTATDGVTVRRNVNCYVVNKATKAENNTNPTAVTVQNKNQVSGSSLSGGKLKITFTNGQSAVTGDNLSYATGTDAKIDDATASKTVNVTTTWDGVYGDVSATQTLTLNNPVNTTGSLSVNSITLKSSGVIPTGTLTASYSNGHTTTHSVNCSTVYKSGTTTDGTATTSESDSCTVSASATVQGKTVTASGTCSWTNPVTALADCYEASRTCPDGTTTVTLNDSTVSNRYATATLNNGANKKVTVSITYPGEKDNVSGYVAYQDYYVSASYGGQTISSFRVRVYNPLTSISVSDKNAYFADDNDCNVTITATAYRKNGASTTVNPSLSYGTNGNSGASYNISGNIYMCAYSGSDRAKWSVTGITATYEGLTDTFDINYTNSFTVKLVKGSTSTSESTWSYNQSQSSYPYVQFDNGSSTSISGCDAYAYVEFENGATAHKAYNATGVSITSGGSALTHTASYNFKNGDGFSSSSSGTSLTSAYMTYTLDGITKGDYAYVYTYTNTKKTYYYSYDIKCIHDCDPYAWESHHAQPSHWSVSITGYRSYKNGTQRTTWANAAYKTFPSNSYSWYIGTNESWGNYSSNNRSSTSGTNNMWNLGSYSGVKARTDLNSNGWYGDDAYIVVSLGSAFYLNDLSHTYNSASENWTWASALEYMGY